MRYSRRSNRGRAQHAPDQLSFESALMGESKSGARFDPRTDRKTLQLCRQVERALMLEAGEVLGCASIISVAPMGSASQLLVRVSVPADVAVSEVMTRLSDRTAQLRSIVVQSIHRKRVPTLTFIAVPEGGHHVD